MLYAILIYGAEGVFDRLPEDEQVAALDKHRALQAELDEEGTMGPIARLMGTTAAVTVRASGHSVMVTDGPFAETKEQLGGFYLIECETIEAAIETVKKLPLNMSSYEIRPVAWANDLALSPKTSEMTYPS